MTLGTFSGINALGVILPGDASITALALLYEKVHLPRNLELVIELTKRYRIISELGSLPERARRLGIDLDADPTFTRVGNDGPVDPLADLAEQHRRRVLDYFRVARGQALLYHELYGPVFHTDFFGGEKPFGVELVKKGKPGENNSYRAVLRDPTVTTEEDEYTRLCEQGYFPIVTGAPPPGMETFAARNVAALLGMLSLKLVLPRTRAATSEEILEAREKLRDHLPPFWAAMLSLTGQIRTRISNCRSDAELKSECTQVVDTVVLPALLDLKAKLERERKLWAYRILSPVQKGLRLLVGNPPLTQQQVLTSAFVLASDVAMDAATQMRAIESLRNNSGLTFLLEVDKHLANSKHRP